MQALDRPPCASRRCPRAVPRGLPESPFRSERASLRVARPEENRFSSKVKERFPRNLPRRCRHPVFRSASEGRGRSRLRESAPHSERKIRARRSREESPGRHRHVGPAPPGARSPPPLSLSKKSPVPRSRPDLSSCRRLRVAVPHGLRPEQLLEALREVGGGLHREAAVQPDARLELARTTELEGD